jgi:hypothetical protein
MHHSRSVARRFFDLVARSSPGDNETINMEDIRKSVFVDLNGDNADNGNEVIYTKMCKRTSPFTGRVYVDRTFKAESQYNVLPESERRDWSRYVDLVTGDLVTEASIVEKNLGVWSTFYKTATAIDSMRGKLITFEEFWGLLCEFELASIHEQGTNTR